MAAIREMSIRDYEPVLGLLESIDGVRLRSADSRDGIARYLERNPGCSFVAEEGGEIVGCIMSGHDGRRGYLQHLAVSPSHRRLGLGSELASRCLRKLAAEGISKSHIDVLTSNAAGAEFWRSQGWQKREDIHRFSFVNSTDRNA